MDLTAVESVQRGAHVATSDAELSKSAKMQAVLDRTHFENPVVLLDRLYFDTARAEVSTFWACSAQLVLLAVLQESMGTGRLNAGSLRSAFHDLSDKEFVDVYGAGTSISARAVKSMSERMRYSLRSYLALLMFD